MTPAPEDWTISPDGLRRTFRFATFADAMAFMQRIAFDCERADHHPEWSNVYNRIDVRLITHSAGAVTDKDIALAVNMNTIFGQFCRKG